jgi:hypothetical protein
VVSTVNPAPESDKVRHHSYSFVSSYMIARFDLGLGDCEWPDLMKLLGTSPVVMAFKL